MSMLRQVWSFHLQKLFMVGFPPERFYIQRPALEKNDRLSFLYAGYVSFDVLDTDVIWVPEFARAG
jgi:hypothetical protein